MLYEQKPSDQIERLEQAVLATAESVVPAITLYGLAEPQTLEVNPQDFSRVLDTRLQVEQATTKSNRDVNYDAGGWAFAEGLYGARGDNWGFNAPTGDQPLAGAEIEITNNIDKLLHERTDGRPVVVLDFGGGLGLSWMRIAAQPRYRTAIAEGRLVMAVTNLGSVPDQSSDDEGYSGTAGSMNRVNKFREANDPTGLYNEEDLRWVQENQDFIQYIDANALELADRSVDLPDGTSIPLMGNVDIIYEQYALGQTHVPDLALASFSELLSDQGTLYSEAATYYHLLLPPQFSEITLENGETVAATGEYEVQRRLALAIGSIMLQQQGFSYKMDTVHHVGVFSRQPGIEDR